jgi:hypothetical protein
MKLLSLIALLALAASGCMNITNEHAKMIYSHRVVKFTAVSLQREANQGIAVQGYVETDSESPSYLHIDIPIQVQRLDRVLSEGSPEKLAEWTREFEKSASVYRITKEVIEPSVFLIKLSDIPNARRSFDVYEAAPPIDRRWLTVFTVPLDLVTFPIQAVYNISAHEGN